MAPSAGHSTGLIGGYDIVGGCPPRFAFNALPTSRGSDLRHEAKRARLPLYWSRVFLVRQ